MKIYRLTNKIHWKISPNFTKNGLNEERLDENDDYEFDTFDFDEFDGDFDNLFGEKALAA